MIRCLQTITLALNKANLLLAEDLGEAHTCLAKISKIIVSPYLLPAGTGFSDIPIFWKEFKRRHEASAKLHDQTLEIDFSYMEPHAHAHDWFLDFYSQNLDPEQDKEEYEELNSVISEAKLAFLEKFEDFNPGDVDPKNPPSES